MDITQMPQIVLDRRNNMMMMHVQLALVLVSGNSLTKVSHYMFMLEAERYHHSILQVTTLVQYKLPPNNDKSCYDKTFHVKNMQVLHLHLTRGSMSQTRKQVLVLWEKKGSMMCRSASQQVQKQERSTLIKEELMLRHTPDLRLLIQQ